MSYKIQPLPTFQRQAKRLIKKFKSLKQELQELNQSLEENPEQGTPLGQNCFKIRLSIRSKGKGKSGGSRIITHVQITGETVYLLSIYDKSDKSTLDEGELDALLSEIEDDSLPPSISPIPNS